MDAQTRITRIEAFFDDRRKAEFDFSEAPELVRSNRSVELCLASLEPEKTRLWSRVQAAYTGRARPRTDEEMQKLSDWMSRRGAYDAASDRARSLADRAVAGLAVLPETNARRLLETVARFVVEREA